MLQALIAKCFLFGETPFAYLMTKRGSKVGEIFFFILALHLEGVERESNPCWELMHLGGVALHCLVTLFDCNSFLIKHLSHTCSCKVYFLLIVCRLKFSTSLGMT